MGAYASSEMDEEQIFKTDSFRMYYMKVPALIASTPLVHVVLSRPCQQSPSPACYELPQNFYLSTDPDSDTICLLS